MATIKLCDWTKERIGKDEPTHVVTVDDKQFEVGEAGMKAILDQLEGEDAPGTPKVKVVERVVEREAPPPPLQAATPGGVQIQVDDEPFDGGPSSAPQPAQAALTPAAPDAAPEDLPPEELLEIPDDTKKRLRAPSPKLAQRIVEEATKFDEGTLPALTMGNRQQRDAMKKLKELEDREEKKLRRSAGSDVNVGERRP